MSAFVCLASVVLVEIDCLTSKLKGAITVETCTTASTATEIIGNFAFQEMDRMLRSEFCHRGA